MYEHEIQEQNVIRSLTELNACTAALACLLEAKGIITYDEFDAYKERMYKDEPYATILKATEDNIAQYEKWQSDPDGGLGDLFANFFSGEQEKTKWEISRQKIWTLTVPNAAK